MDLRIQCNLCIYTNLWTLKQRYQTPSPILLQYQLQHQSYKFIMPLSLYLSACTAFDSSYCTEDGQVIYKVDSPFKLVGRRATIDKVLPQAGGFTCHSSAFRAARLTSTCQPTLTVTCETIFRELGKSNSVLSHLPRLYGKARRKTSGISFERASGNGIAWEGKLHISAIAGEDGANSRPISDRIFTGTDGVEYRWAVGNKTTTPAVS